MRAVAITLAAAAVVAGFAGSAQAQLDPSLVNGLSSSCATGLVGLVTNSSVSSCLNLPTAVGALTSAGNSSVVPGLNSYLNSGVCKTACNSTQLAQANGTLLQSCSSDLQSSSGSSNSIPGLVYYFINSYDRIRDAGCLQGSDGQSCLVKDMYVLQNTTQMPITFTGIQELLSNQTAQGQALEALSMNKTAFCSDCTHGLYSILFPNNSNAQLASAINATCNSTFTNGQIPSSLKQTATGNSTSSSSSSSGSGSSGSSGSGHNAAAGINTGAITAFGSALALVAAGFALL